MTANQLVPAAQYLRMSTEHQQYSLANQSTAIQTYAEFHGFEVVRTYSDPAKSGLVLKHRTGLRQLLQDVVSGSPAYRVILVYDVSRWGRFQDTDESAHYEFLCKSAGVPVHYCAETFANDGTLPSLIMKALKRTMAGEYSRELGVKVLAGLKRQAHLGFKQGGMPGYGLRRMLVSHAGVPKQVLASGERKSIHTDRVILVPGPAHEVQCVKDIFRMLVSKKRTVRAIARELNCRGVAYVGGGKWDYQAVYSILIHPKYVGCHVFGRTSARLYTPMVKVPKSEWILKPGAFEPIIDAETFAEAQKILEGRTFNKTDEELLDGLRALLASERRLTLPLIKHSADLPSPSTYQHRFGSLRRAYELIGYGHPDQFSSSEMRRRTQALRRELIAKIVSTFPNEISVVRRGGRWRSRLRMSTGLIVSVLVARSMRTRTDTLRWLIAPVQDERKFITLLARLDASNRTLLDFHVFPNIDHRKRFHISLGDSWLNRGTRLNDVSRLCEVVERARLARKGKPRESRRPSMVW
jgi:DNA invertase Pin-like site-specific DNA recombinase